jgi:hypothetical protein
LRGTLAEQIKRPPAPLRMPPLLRTGGEYAEAAGHAPRAAGLMLENGIGGFTPMAANT